MMDTDAALLALGNMIQVGAVGLIGLMVFLIGLLAMRLRGHRRETERLIERLHAEARPMDTSWLGKPEPRKPMKTQHTMSWPARPPAPPSQPVYPVGGGREDNLPRPLWVWWALFWTIADIGLAIVYVALRGGA